MLYYAVLEPITGTQYCIVLHIECTFFSWLHMTFGHGWSRVGQRSSSCQSNSCVPLKCSTHSDRATVSNGLSLYWTPEAVFWTIVINLWRASAVTLPASQHGPQRCPILDLTLYCLQNVSPKNCNHFTILGCLLP